ncbi:hypothetical protein [Streptomyces sp. NRRL F-5135]|uniref:hypothetical protein n=1 Tax=Streptomyces sp. NRRL F-5135 TaxID=1463858 RepID=UPI00068B13A6|nr:hypothetical protein [Streptomyces sp. NRRL F-5135]
MAAAIEAPASNTAEGPTSHTQNQLDALEILRRPFQPSQISKLPKVSCTKCSKAQFKVCEQHTRQRCDTCASTLTTKHVHLDYVGHAELTGRLLEADPLWTWEPMAFDADGLPKFDQVGGLWIRLTVGGHTRIGYGNSDGKTGPNAAKEAIGDALRNAAMRFGAALDLWSKTDMDKAAAERDQLTAEPSREDRLDDLYSLMQKRWGHLEGLRAVKVQVGEENFHESQVHDAQGTLRLFGELIDDRIRELLDAQKKEQFLRRVRKGWDERAVVEQHLAEAREKRLLDHLVPAGKDKVPTRIEDLLTDRLAELSPDNGESDGSQSEAGASAAGASAGTDDEAADRHVQRLIGQVASERCWNNPIALVQIKGDADKHGVLDRQVQGPDGAWLPMRKLLDGRIAGLNEQTRKAAPGGDTGRGAA